MHFRDLIYSKMGRFLESSEDSEKLISQLKDSKLFLVEKDFHTQDAIVLADVNTALLDSPLPFKTCFFEMNHKEHSLSAFQNYQGDMTGSVFALMAHELSPGIVELTACIDIGMGKEIMPRIVHVTLKYDSPQTEEIPKALGLLLEGLCKYIHGCNLGIEHVFKSINLRTPLIGVHSHKLESIVRLCPKKYNVYPSATIGSKIDWSMRWWVRGHWRKHFGGIGKDRFGEYTVKNFTWVTEHLRGADDAPIKETIYNIRGANGESQYA